MANIKNVEKEEDLKNFIEELRKVVQSTNINFLLGSGCSLPAIQVLGEIENKIQGLIDDGEVDKASKEIFDFLKIFPPISKELHSGKTKEKTEETNQNYISFLRSIFSLLSERKSNILHNQATIFTTNYDLFIECASEHISCPLKINDGFHRSPALNGKHKFSPSEFFHTISSNGNLYNYRVTIPTVNLIKLHGSLNWNVENGSIYHIQPKIIWERISSAEAVELSEDYEEFNKLFSVILPQKEKFRHTLINQTYYDLLRIYSNELDKENTVLIVEGFSFADEHILEITKRALRNPTLKLIVFCYDITAKKRANTIFKEYNNVDIVYKKEDTLGFSDFNYILEKIMPQNLQTIELI